VKRYRLATIAALEFTVPGQARAMPRARLTTVGGHARAYTPSWATRQKELVQMYFQSYLTAAKVTVTPEMYTGPVRIEIGVYVPFPASFSKAKRACPSYPCATRPDWDNYGKLVSDALNGIAFRDDGQIVYGSVAKVYAERPQTVVSLEWYRVAEVKEPA
jgi:Holliday junction resolvase RusA-like endonuclease